MKFAYVGTQCSGKTTALWATGVHLKNMGITDFTLLIESARQCPYPLNMKTTFLTTSWILLHQILNEARAESRWTYVVTDRCVVDQLMYLEHALRGGYKEPHCTSREHSELEYVRKSIIEWIKLCPYDHIFFFHPLPLVGDADRPPNIIYQLEIDNLFAEYLPRYFDEDHITHINFPDRRRRCGTVAQLVYEAIIRDKDKGRKKN